MYNLQNLTLLLLLALITPKLIDLPKPFTPLGRMKFSIKEGESLCFLYNYNEPPEKNDLIFRANRLANRDIEMKIYYTPNELNYTLEKFDEFFNKTHPDFKSFLHFTELEQRTATAVFKEEKLKKGYYYVVLNYPDHGIKNGDEYQGVLIADTSKDKPHFKNVQEFNYLKPFSLHDHELQCFFITELKSVFTVTNYAHRHLNLLFQWQSEMLNQTLVEVILDEQVVTADKKHSYFYLDKNPEAINEVLIIFTQKKSQNSRICFQHPPNDLNMNYLHNKERMNHIKLLGNVSFSLYTLQNNERHTYNYVVKVPDKKLDMLDFLEVHYLDHKNQKIQPSSKPRLLKKNGLHYFKIDEKAELLKFDFNLRYKKGKEPQYDREMVYDTFKIEEISEEIYEQKINAEDYTLPKKNEDVNLLKFTDQVGIITVKLDNIYDEPIKYEFEGKWLKDDFDFKIKVLDATQKGTALKLYINDKPEPLKLFEGDFPITLKHKKNEKLTLSFEIVHLFNSFLIEVQRVHTNFVHVYKEGFYNLNYEVSRKHPAIIVFDRQLCDSEFPSQLHLSMENPSKKKVRVCIQERVGEAPFFISEECEKYYDIMPGETDDRFYNNDFLFESKNQVFYVEIKVPGEQIINMKFEYLQDISLTLGEHQFMKIRGKTFLSIEKDAKNPKKTENIFYQLSTCPIAELRENKVRENYFSYKLGESSFENKIDLDPNNIKYFNIYGQGTLNEGEKIQVNNFLNDYQTLIRYYTAPENIYNFGENPNKNVTYEVDQTKKIIKFKIDRFFKYDMKNPNSEKLMIEYFVLATKLTHIKLDNLCSHHEFIQKKENYISSFEISDKEHVEIVLPLPDDYLWKDIEVLIYTKLHDFRISAVYPAINIKLISHMGFDRYIFVLCVLGALLISLIFFGSFLNGYKGKEEYIRFAGKKEYKNNAKDAKNQELLKDGKEMENVI